MYITMSSGGIEKMVFKVQHIEYGTTLRVYATKINEYGDTYFLFYDGKWSWREAADYKPCLD